MPRFFLRKEFWAYLLAGAFFGLAYTWIDVGVLDESVASHGVLSAAHEVFDTFFPIVSGISIALGVFFLKQISRLNKRLSLKNEQLKKELLFNTLISQMLHEIQGPIHNISAAFEDSEKELSADKTAIIRRNLDRLAELKKQYGEGKAGLDDIHPEKPVALRKWLRAFIEDKARNHIEKSRIRYQENVEAVTLKIHPMLLEQVLMTLFSNAFEALEALPAEQRELFLRARIAEGQPSLVEISLKNKRSFFSEEVLKKQGKRLTASRHGFGLGLLLVNRMIEQVGGKLHLENSQDGALVTVTLPGEHA